MTMGLLQRRKPKRSGIKRAPERVWRRHETWVRGFACIAFKVDGDACSGKVRTCHYRTAANSGTSVKPFAWFTFPACDHHHSDVQHQEGQKAFERRYGVNLERECLKLARMSPDLEMRAAMREAGL